MPCNYSHGCSNPAKDGVKDDFSKPAYGSPAQKRPHNALNKTLWNAMQKRDRWPSYKDQRRGDPPEEQVLDHANGQQFVIQYREPRSPPAPDRNDSRPESRHQYQ